MRRLPLTLIYTALALWVGGAGAHSSDLSFTLHKKGSGSGPTLLVIGGIQGDEPGGFNAASLLVTDYEIAAGNVWVVPNLNFESIVRSARGVHGDMNRKFHHIDSSDPQYHAVQKIKEIILDAQIDMVLNLHDGSGFYRAQHVDPQHSPRRWGQCIVIDQESIGGIGMQALGDVARRVIGQVNGAIVHSEHHYRIKNTRTSEGNAEMAKTLTYFAIRNGKPAAGVESSKSLPTHRRAYYHLSIIEGYMHELGIQYGRGFELTPGRVRHEIDSNVQLALYDRISLDMADARKRLRYVPMKKGAPLQFTASNPLVAVIDNEQYYHVNYGNRSVTQLHPQYFDYDEGMVALPMEIDGVAVRVPIGSVVQARNDIFVEPMAGYRINAIGYKQPGLRNESGVTIHRGDFMERFSIDRGGRLFRVEIYRGEMFSGMVLVRFVDEPLHTVLVGQ